MLDILRCLKVVLEKVPRTLQNKGMLNRYRKDITKFAAVLCSLFTPSPSLPFERHELPSAVYSVLAALASYNRKLEQELQKKWSMAFSTSKCNRV